MTHFPVLLWSHCFIQAVTQKIKLHLYDNCPVLFLLLYLYILLYFFIHSRAADTDPQRVCHRYKQRRGKNKWTFMYRICFIFVSRGEAWSSLVKVSRRNMKCLISTVLQLHTAEHRITLKERDTHTEAGKIKWTMQFSA